MYNVFANIIFNCVIKGVSVDASQLYDFSICLNSQHRPKSMIHFVEKSLLMKIPPY